MHRSKNKFLYFLKIHFQNQRRCNLAKHVYFGPSRPRRPPLREPAHTKNCEFELPKKTIALQVFSQNRAMCDQKFEWTFPCFLGGLNACPDGLGYLFTTKTVILQIFSNWSQSAQPQSARLSARGGQPLWSAWSFSSTLATAESGKIIELTRSYTSMELCW